MNNIISFKVGKLTIAPSVSRVTEGKFLLFPGILTSGQTFRQLNRENPFCFMGFTFTGSVTPLLVGLFFACSLSRLPVVSADVDPEPCGLACWLRTLVVHIPDMQFDEVCHLENWELTVYRRASLLGSPTSVARTSPSRTFLPPCLPLRRWPLISRV